MFNHLEEVLSKSLSAEMRQAQAALADKYGFPMPMPKPETIKLDPSLNALVIQVGEDGNYRIAISTENEAMKSKLEFAAFKIRSAIPRL